jgi:hypothetical protein
MEERPRPPHERLSEVPPPEPGPSPWGEAGPEAPPQADGREHQCLEFCPICRTADVVRAALPPEAREHWHTFQREGLLAARAMLDHYIRHLDAQPPAQSNVEDIPIE